MVRSDPSWTAGGCGQGLQQAAKAVAINDFDYLTLNMNEALLSHAIDMDNGETEMVGDLLLRQRLGDAGLFDQAVSM